MKDGRLKNTTKNLCYAAVAVALLSVCSWISLPIGALPITLQSLALFTIIGLLGAKRAFFAVLAYLLLGLIGVPVFAGFIGGVGKLFTPAGGYLIGFLVIAPIVAFACEKIRGGLWKNILVMSGGMLVCYVIAVVWMLVLSSIQNTSIGFVGAVSLLVLPYLPFDLVKIFFAAFLTKKLKGKI